MLPERLQEATRALAAIYKEVPSLETTHALAELEYLTARRLESQTPDTAINWYLKSLLHSYAYVFDPRFESQRSAYDPQFRTACDLYNSSLEQFLRYAEARHLVQPGRKIKLNIDGQAVQLDIVGSGFGWKQAAFQQLKFVSDYQVTGLTNRHHKYGLGVPLIAVHRREESPSPADEYYLDGVSFPVTAILRCGTSQERPDAFPESLQLELRDPLATEYWTAAGQVVPLQSDITTPLAYFLDSADLQRLETYGLLRPDHVKQVAGLYMLQPYDPHKIPVLMIHGFWSSPATWMDVVNDLRSRPGIRDHFQFWFYLYPTGEPFWETAADVRADLHTAVKTLAADTSHSTLDDMVVVGHSMGGLVARMLTLSSGDTFWQAVSSTPIQQLNTSPETRQQLERLYYFEPSRPVRRVVMIGSPHKGSGLSNSVTQWLARNVIYLPQKTLRTAQQLLLRNPRLSPTDKLVAPKTSVDGLAPDSPILQAMQTVSSNNQVQLHSIIGARNRSDPSEIDDGIVTYVSAHRDDIESEIIVQADHNRLHRHPRTIEELQRILLRHLQESQQTAPSGIVHIKNLGHSQPAVQGAEQGQRGQRTNDQ